MTTVAAFASLAVVALGSPASASGQQGQPWTIKEFEVVAVEPAGVVEGDLVLHELVEKMIRTIRAETNYDPDFPLIWDEPTVSFDGIEETKAEIETVLRKAAAKLESWGFPPPWLEPVVENELGVRAYRIYLVTGRKGIAGRYHARPCDFGIKETVIVLNADAILSSGVLTDFGVQTAVHELVHATQFGHAAYSCGLGYPGQWIGEGTADAIGWDVAKQLRGFAVFRHRWARAWGARMYSEQLPVPGGTGTPRAYRSLSFWRFLAEYTQSKPTFPDGSATWPVDYSYVPRLLGRDFSPRDCYAEGAPCDEELRWLDAGLRAEFGLPLRDLYARFLQAYAQYGEERVHSTEGGTPATRRRNWLGASFAHEDGMGCPEVVLGPEADRRQRKFTVARFADVAARCWEIDLEGFEQDVILAVTAAYRLGTEALVEQLTAVMADQSGRVDKAEVRTVADVPEATWYYDHLGAADPTSFLLTNVADQPDATRGLANLSVTFTALESNAVVSVSGAGDSGVSGGSGGLPLGDPTAGFAATRWWFGVHTSDEIAAATPASQLPPPGDACAVQLTLVSEDVVGDEDVSVTLMGWLPAPLAPGAWPVGKYQFEDRLGELYADVAVPCQFGGCGEGHKYRMVGFHGELEFTDVSRSHVAGRFDITAGAGEPYAGVGLSGIYSVTLGGPAGAGKKTMRADHPCAPAPPDSKPGTPGGNGADDVGDGPSEEPDGDGDGDGDPGTEEEEEEEQEEDGPQGAGGAPGEADPGATGEAAGAGDQKADGPPSDADPQAQGGELRASELILGFPQDGRSVLTSEPQVVQGTGSVTSVTLASRTYDLTVALPVFGCTVEMGDASAAEQFQLALAHDRWLKSGRTLHGLVLFDFTAAELRLDATSGGVTLDLESAEGGVTMLGTAENAVSLRAGGPATIVGNVSDATLEVTRGDDTFSCAEPMAFSFTVARMD